VLFGLLVLSKEQFVLVPLGIAAWELLRPGRRVRDVWIFAACIVPAACWWVYARIQLGAWFTTGAALTLPLAGWKRALLDAGSGTYSPDAAVNIGAESTLVVLAALLILLAVAGLLALRLRGPTDAAYISIGVVAACLVANSTTFLRDALRNTAVLVTLVPFAFASLPLLPWWAGRRPARARDETEAERRPQPVLEGSPEA
jgi:hypothetical protein